MESQEQIKQAAEITREQSDTVDRLIQLSQVLINAVRDSLIELRTIRRAFVAMSVLLVLAGCALSVLIVRVQGEIAQRETAAVLASQMRIYDTVQAIRIACPAPMQSISPD